MLFPKNRLNLTKTYQAKTDPEGWLVLDISALDMEGVKKFYIPFEDIKRIQERGEIAVDKLKQARALLGGDWESEEEKD